MNNLWLDIRYALRHLRKSPGFALTAVLTLALGIGANAAIFTLVDSILLRPLPFPAQDRLMRIGYGTGTDPMQAPFPKGWIRALAGHASSFASISGFGADTESNVGDASAPDRVFSAEVMANAFQTLAIRPALGRFFSPEDAIAGHEPVVVLSYGYWRNHFAEDPSAIGQSIRIDGVWRRIVGVMPAGVRFPYADTQFVTPVTFKSWDPVDPWNDFDLFAFGRLAAGVTPGHAQAEMRRLQKLLLPLFPWIMPDSWASDTAVLPMLESEVGATRPKLLLLLAAVALILLIACANVANLTLARATARERDMAIRGALGAPASRLLRQLLSESLVIGLAAGAVGLLAAFAGLRAFVRLLPADTPRLDTVSLGWPDILFTLGTSLIAGLLFGLIPAIKMASPNRLEALRIGNRSLAGRGSRFGPSMVLVMAQIGLSVVVITTAGLVLHSLWSLSKIDPGFRTDRIVTAEVSLDANTCPNPKLTPGGAATGRCQAFFETLLDRLQGLPGEENVALTSVLPLSGRYGSYAFDAEGHPRSARQDGMLATERTVSPGFFGALGMSLMRGRLLNEQDFSGASHAVVINEHLADHLWPHQNPLGRHVMNVVDEATPAVWNASEASVIVGVVSNTRDGSLAAAVGDEAYFPMTPAGETPQMYVLLRTRAGSEDAAVELRQIVAGINAQVPVTHVRSLGGIVAASLAAPRALALLLLAFGSLAVVIGAVGVYSLIAYIVSWRTREIGLRLALGAQRWQIVMAVVRQSLLLAGGGCAAGLAGAAALSRVLHSFLFEVSPVDPMTFVTVPALMLLVALTAAWNPARRAASIEPMQALRTE